MKINKKILPILVFILSMFYVTNVRAEMVSYGYVECDYECSAPKSLDGNDPYISTICHDRWSPTNTCKKSDGSFVSSAVSHENALTINFGTDGVAGVVTDLFGFGADNFTGHPEKEYTKLGIAKDDPNVYVYRKGIIGGYRYFIHDYTPIAEYYKKTGKYPENIVVSLIGKTSWNDFLVIKYYPSDYQTTERDHSLNGAFAAAYKNDNFKELVTSTSKIFWYSDTATRRIDFCKRVDTSSEPPQACAIPQTVGTYSAVNTLHFYYSRNLASTDLNSCDDLEADFNYMNNLFDQYGEESKAYNDAKIDFVQKCHFYQGKSYNSENSKCNDCLALEDKMAEKDPSFMKPTNHCGFGEDMIAWLLRMLKIIRYIVPIIVIVLSILDYIGAIASAEDDAMKKVGARFSKRLLIMILIFILPALLQFIFNVFKIDGLDSSNPYCLKK